MKQQGKFPKPLSHDKSFNRKISVNQNLNKIRKEESHADIAVALDIYKLNVQIP